MDSSDNATLRELVALLAAALALADRIDETLLGAKIDEALEYAKETLARVD